MAKKPGYQKGHKPINAGCPYKKTVMILGGLGNIRRLQLLFICWWLPLSWSTSSWIIVRCLEATTTSITFPMKYLAGISAIFFTRSWSSSVSCAASGSSRRGTACSVVASTAFRSFSWRWSSATSSYVVHYVDDIVTKTQEYVFEHRRRRGVREDAPVWEVWAKPQTPLTVFESLICNQMHSITQKTLYMTAQHPRGWNWFIRWLRVSNWGQILCGTAALLDTQVKTCEWYVSYVIYAPDHVAFDLNMLLQIYTKKNII